MVVGWGYSAYSANSSSAADILGIYTLTVSRCQLQKSGLFQAKVLFSPILHIEKKDMRPYTVALSGPSRAESLPAGYFFHCCNIVTAALIILSLI